MIYTFTLLFLAILAFKIITIYQNYLRIKKNFDAFCKKWGLVISPRWKILHPDIPEVQAQNWKLIWKKQGKGRSFHHILKIYFTFNKPIQDFQLAHKNLLPKIPHSQNWKEVATHFYANTTNLNKDFLKEVMKIQSEYGWGVLEVKNQEALYSLIAEPWENQAWKHVEEVILLLKKL